jgi:outer membrane murein-binding lipoprotein Lpp
MVKFERTAMKRPVYKAVILTAGVVIILIAGCSGQDASKSEIKRGRLIAAENKQLKKQSEQLRKELENQKELFAKRLPEEKATEENIKLRQTIDRLNAQVEQLKEEVKDLKGSKKYKEWEEEMQKSIRDTSESIAKDLEEIGKLREENENLKMEITELKKELETHKGPTPLPHTD